MNPPQKPTITKVRRPGLAGSGPSNMVSVPKKEMMKLPTTLMRMVPQGNALPHMLALAMTDAVASHASERPAQRDPKISNQAIPPRIRRTWWSADTENPPRGGLSGADGPYRDLARQELSALAGGFGGPHPHPDLTLHDRPSARQLGLEWSSAGRERPPPCRA